MVKIVECEWASWCEKECQDKRIMQISNKNGYGTYLIEQPIEKNLGICDYYRVRYDNVIKKGADNGKR